LKPLVPLSLPITPPTSYWQSGANEMAGVKNILIIVNAAVANCFERLKVLIGKGKFGKNSSGKWRIGGANTAILR
jgi:hypothetical protein